MNEPVLRVEQLSVAYRVGRDWLTALRELSLTIAPGETIGLVGESGSGKTTAALAVLDYLGPGGRVTGGRIWFDGRDITALAPAERRALWGRRIAFVPQNPQSALNPSLRVGEQLAEPLRFRGLDGAAAQQRARELLTAVRAPDPERIARSYPHELSGGMLQRILIAMALGAEPDLLILDEPTTNLDVTTQAAVLDLLRDLIAAKQTAVLYVTHNLGVVARLCNRVAVLYAGELVEEAPTAALFARPLHPYTSGLAAAAPHIERRAVAPTAIPGQIPPLRARSGIGCIFAERCPVAVAACRDERPPLVPVGDSLQRVRCLRQTEIAAGLPVWPTAEPLRATADPAHTAQPLLAVEQAAVHFPLRRSPADWLRRRPRPVVRAVDGVDLTLARGQTLGVVGESGSGKTTLARAVIGLTARTGGQISLHAAALAPALSRRALGDLRRIQYVFQNPEAALNPHLTVGETLQRPLITLLGLSTAAAAARVPALLAAVQLPPAYATRRPAQLSGGEKQRVAIARAFAAQPELLIADEAVSALDVSVQAAVLALLQRLQLETEVALLFISHDLAVVAQLADQIAVLYAGQVLEFRPTAALLHPPYHPYTEALLSAIPSFDPLARAADLRLEGEPPDQTGPRRGCPFASRCPQRIGPLCDDAPPPWQPGPQGARYACHLAPEELAARQRPLGVEETP